MTDTLRRLSTASVVMSGLPEYPGYNGSAFVIDDIEAAEVVRAIDAGRSEIEELRGEVAAVRGSHNLLFREKERLELEVRRLQSAAGSKGLLLKYYRVAAAEVKAKGTAELKAELEKLEDTEND